MQRSDSPHHNAFLQAGAVAGFRERAASLGMGDVHIMAVPTRTAHFREPRHALRRAGRQAQLALVRLFGAVPGLH